MHFCLKQKTYSLITLITNNLEKEKNNNNVSVESWQTTHTNLVSSWKSINQLINEVMIFAKTDSKPTITDVQTSKRNSPLLILLVQKILSSCIFGFAAQLQKRLADFDTSSVFPSERGWEDNGWITISGMKLFFKNCTFRDYDNCTLFRHRFQSTTRCSVLLPISQTCLCICCSVVFVFFYYTGPVVMWLVGPRLIAICLF